LGSEGKKNDGDENKSTKKAIWQGTTRRNTMIGVEYGLGSGRILSSHLSKTMTNIDDNGFKTTSLVMNAMKDLQMSKKKAMMDKKRRERAYLAARYQHQVMLDSNPARKYLEGKQSIYGSSRF
jgi:hypothetical protein